MADQALPSADMLRQLLTYEPETGRLFWKERPVEMFGSVGYGGAEGGAARWNAKWAGKEAFTALYPAGYRRGTVQGRQMQAHRVIWAMQAGAWPLHEIDHCDGDPGNNRWANLRLATRTENSRNRSSATKSSSKYIGVSWAYRQCKWKAQIGHAATKMGLGYFDDEVEAARAYDAAAKRRYGVFSRPNFK